MKRFFIALVAFACAATFSSFRTKTAPVPTGFYQQFHGATNVNWTDVDGMLRVEFNLNGRHQYAFYSGDQMVVLATDITVQQMPHSLRQQLKAFSNYQLSQTYVLENGSVKEYYVVLDDAHTHITLQGRKRWKVFLKENK